MKVLVVEDNTVLSDRIKRQLSKQYLVDIVHTGAEALEKVKDIEYAVIVLDLGLPDMTGLMICRHLRRMDIESPILILTAVDNISSRVQLLDSGADDYLTKPFDSNELRARVAALARRQPLHRQKPIIRFRDLIMDTEQRKVSRAGVIISLRRKEFDILEYLVTNSGRVLTRQMIMNHAWDSTQTSWLTTVDVHIKHLRDKIDRPFPSTLIKTAYGIGYKVDNPEQLIKERTIS